MELVGPSMEWLAGYAAALEAGWSPNNLRDVSGEHLAAVREDVGAFLDDLTRREGGTVTLADGRVVARLPMRVWWMWDGEFCGQISLRWEPGTEELPSYVQGHVGYTVVPWKRGRGYATRALGLVLPAARALGLPRVTVTCDADNAASRRVVEANGGVLVRQEADPAHGSGEKLVFRVPTGGEGSQRTSPSL